MAEATQRKAPPIMLYTEATPNPESLKFVTNRMIFKGIADFPEKEWAEEWSPMATELFKLPYVRAVHISNNFVTISKELDYSWYSIKLKLKEWIKEYIDSGNTVIKDGFIEAQEGKKARERADIDYSVDDAVLVNRIQELLETHIQPGVASDGGNVEFKSYKDGVVNVTMQGSCSGCPSATMTLKAGIETMLKQMVPQVREVRAEME